MNKALRDSFAVHSLIVLAVLSFVILGKKKEIETFNFDLVEKSAIEIKKNPKVVINAKAAKATEVKSQKKLREVFGVKRKAQTSREGIVRAKIGNTLTKKEDNKILREDESDSLPKPAEEFLITSMPRAIEEVRPEYPLWAKEQKISGSVVFEILIDRNGVVRQAKLLRGLNPKLDKLALKAILKFKFKPGFIDKKPIAVRIKYAIKYILES